MATFFKIPIRLIKTTLAAYIVTAIMLLLLSYLMYKYEISGTALNVGLVLTYIIPNFMAGLITGKMMKEKRLLWGVVSGIMYMIVYVLVNLIIGDSVTIGKILLPLIISVTGAALGGIVS